MDLFNASFPGLIIRAGTKKVAGLNIAFFWHDFFLGCVFSFLVMVNLRAATT